MKTSYKIALALCLLILTGSIGYAALKNKKAKPADPEMLANANGSTDPLVPQTPPPSSAPPTIVVAPPVAGNTPTVTEPAPVPPPPTLPEPTPTPQPTVETPAAKPPAVETPVAPPAAKPAPAPKPAPAASPDRTYTVRSGDTLSSISQKFYGTQKLADKIYKANHKTIGSNPNRLKLGMKLAIPPK